MLRRPPLGHVLATAHDMGREHRIISALGPHRRARSRRAIGLCTDEAVNGAPFYVMGFVDGHVVRDAETAETVLDAPSSAARPASRIVDVLADIHAVDVDAVGLGDLGRKEGYIERQLKRWYASSSSRRRRRACPLVDEVHDALLGAASPSRARPRSCTATTASTTACSATTGDVAAVLDWEICTLGDPLADVGLLMVYWAEPGDEHAALLDARPPPSPGFPTPRPSCSSATPSGPGRDLSRHRLLRRLRLLEAGLHPRGVYARYVGGAMGGDAPAASRASPTRSSASPTPPATPSSGSTASMTALRARRAARRSSRPVLVVALEGWIDAGLGAADGAAPRCSSRARAP